MKRLALLSAVLLGLTSGAAAQDDPVVLLTGFEPWGSRTNNPSWEGVKLLEGEMIEGHLVRTKELAVDYRKVTEDVPVFLGSVPRPAVSIHFGVAGSPDLRFERKAHNQARWIRDDGGYAPVDNRVAEDGPMIYTSELPEAEILEGMNEAGHAIRTSDSAGSYLCEFTFYTGLYHREKLGQTSAAGFIHVPYFRTREPAVNAETLAAGMRELVAIVLRKRRADAAAAQTADPGLIPSDPSEPGPEDADPEAQDPGATDAEGEAAGADSVPYEGDLDDGRAAGADSVPYEGDLDANDDPLPEKAGLVDVLKQDSGSAKPANTKETKEERRARKKREREARREERKKKKKQRRFGPR